MNFYFAKVEISTFVKKFDFLAKVEISTFPLLRESRSNITFVLQIILWLLVVFQTLSSIFFFSRKSRTLQIILLQSSTSV